MKPDKKLPQVIELERAVLGALIIEANAIEQICTIIVPDTFYLPKHIIIYDTIYKLHCNSMPIDLLVLQEQLLKNGNLEKIGGISYLIDLTNVVASSANIETHTRILLQKQIQRELIKMSNYISTNAYEDVADIFELLEEAERTFDMLRSNIYKTSVNTAFEVWKKQIPNILLPPPKPLSIPSVLGIRHDIGTIDCFGAKPGTGKTAVMIQGAIEAVKQGYKVGILSLELNSRLLVAKFQHHLYNVSAKSIIRNELNDFQKNILLEKDNPNNDILKDIYIDDTFCTSHNIRSKIVTLVKKYECEIIWIDYVQLITIYSQKGQTDTKGMELTLTLLQQTAKELNICIVILSQLTRGVEKPSMEELRGGGVEQACTKIILLFDENQKKYAGSPFLEIPEEDRGKLVFINDKERFDDKGNLDVYYDKITQKFYRWDDKPEPYPYKKENNEYNKSDSVNLDKF